MGSIWNDHAMFRRRLRRRAPAADAAARSAQGPTAEAVLEHLPPHQRWLLEHAEDRDRRIVEQCLAYSVTGVARLLALIDGVRYVVAGGPDGAFAECGVWRGGSVLAMILTLQDEGVTDRDIHLYDTFEGMTAPTEKDTTALGDSALDIWRQAEDSGERAWAYLFDEAVFDEADVRRTVLGTGYPEERVHFVKGPVEETLPAAAPGPLALLRLDTDWYESTLHEMQHLYPLLAPGGILIVDDYGHWEGSRRAVDEYYAAHPPAPLLSRIDYSARIAVKA